MSKELEVALKLLKIETQTLDQAYIQFVIDLIEKEITPPTTKQVCEELSKYFKSIVEITYFENEIIFRVRNNESEIVKYYTHSKYLTIYYDLPIHLCSLITKYFESVVK